MTKVTLSGAKGVCRQPRPQDFILPTGKSPGAEVGFPPRLLSADGAGMSTTPEKICM